jgi:hypothetical protein
MSNGSTSWRELHCEQCGGQEQLAVIFKQLLCRFCAVALIQELRRKETGHASEAR